MSMSRYSPTVRGWVALLLPLSGAVLFPALLPARFIESGVGTWLAEPVSPFAWGLGGLLMLTCVAACVEAVRRGSRTDRVFSCIAAVFSYLLIYEYFDLFMFR